MQNVPSQQKMLVSTVKELVATALFATSSRKQSSGCHRKVLEMIAKICRYAAENGNKNIITKFTEDLGFELYETTVRSFKMAYYEQ